MVVGEKVSLEEMGGARMHCTVSGCGRPARRRRRRGHRAGAALLLLPAGQLALRRCRPTRPEEPSAPLTRHTVPERESQPFDIHEVIDGLVDDDVVLRDQAAVRRRARHRVRPDGGRDRRHRRQQLDGQGRRAVHRQRRQGRAVHLAVRRLLDPAGLPRRRAGLHDRLRGRARRHHPARRQDGLTPCPSATVPQFCVIVRKAYGAGLYAMGGPGFGPGRHDRAAHRADRRDGARGGGQRGLRQQDRRDRATRPSASTFVQDMRREYEEDVDLERLAADLVLDQIIEADALRAELLLRLRYAKAPRPPLRRPSAATSRRSDPTRRGSEHTPSAWLPAASALFACASILGGAAAQASRRPCAPWWAECAARATAGRARSSSSRSSGSERPTTLLGSPSMPGDVGAAEPVEREGPGHPQRLARRDVGLDLVVVELGEVHRRRGRRAERGARCRRRPRRGCRRPSGRCAGRRSGRASAASARSPRPGDERLAVDLAVEVEHRVAARR